jgi:hypothetical protein
MFVLSVVSDVPVDSETPVVTSSILRIADLVFEDALGVGFAHVFIGISVHVLWCLRCTV